MSTKYDAIVIGTGQAGPSLAGRLAVAGMKTAVIERKRFGGTCVNNGCIPTKTLVASARSAHVARRGSDFGINIPGEITANMKAVKARKDGVVKQSNEGLEKWLKSTSGITVHEGHGRFEGPHKVRVGDELLEADKIFINVGGRAQVPDNDLRGHYFTNSSIMDVDFLPEHLVIIGGSYIGLEFGQMYRRFGSKVTIVEMMPRVISREDEDTSETIREILESEGIELRLNSKCIRARYENGKIVVQLDCADNNKTATGSHLLYAVGRRPNTDDLGLDQAGVETDSRGYIKVDDQLRTSVPGVWALGDCNGKGAFTHTAYNDFEIVAANLLDNDPRRVTDRINAYNLYIDPPLGRCGMTEAEVRKSGKKALICKRPMTRVGRAVEKGETAGFMKAIVDAESKQFLGAAILGIEGDEVIHSILDVMYAGAPYTVIQRAMHIHPTVSELIPTMLADLKPMD